MKAESIEDDSFEEGGAMIRAAGVDKANGRPFILLGLSQENWSRLLGNEPIKFAGEALGYAGDIIILGSPTDEAVESDLREFGVVGEHTRCTEVGSAHVE